MDRYMCTCRHGSICAHIHVRVHTYISLSIYKDISGCAKVFAIKEQVVLGKD